MQQTLDYAACARDRCHHWSVGFRCVVFVLAAAWPAAVVVRVPGWVPVQTFLLAAALPAMLVLGLLAYLDRRRGDGRLWRLVRIATLAGLAATLAYSLVRLPFAFVWGEIGRWMLMGTPLAPPTDSHASAEMVAGCFYHLINGCMLAIMYVALIGQPDRRSWAWAMPFAFGLSGGIFVSRYTHFFGIEVDRWFIANTVAAYAVYGLVIGLVTRTLAGRAVR